MSALFPSGCKRGCACECHGDLDDPGPHLATCAWSDPDFDPDFVVETLRDAGMEPEVAK